LWDDRKYSRLIALDTMVLMRVAQDKLASKSRTSTLKVVTRWIGPAGVEKEGMEVESVQPRIISLVSSRPRYWHTVPSVVVCAVMYIAALYADSSPTRDTGQCW